MLRRASLLLLMVLTACQPAPLAKPPVQMPDAGLPSVPIAAPTAVAIHGTVRGLRGDVYALLAALPLVPVAGATVSLNGLKATTGADGTFDLTAPAGGTLEVRYDVNGKSRLLLGPAVPNAVVDPVSTLVIRKARAMMALGAIAAMPSAEDVAKLAAALQGSVTAPAAALEDDLAAAQAFDQALAGSQTATQAVGTLAWAVRTPSQQLTKPLDNLTARVTTLAGTGLASTDGPAAGAQLLAPAGLARDAAGNMFVADAAAHLIRKTAPDGSVSTIAGSGTPGFADGQGAAASFNAPAGIAVDSAGNLIVADAGNHAIRKISPAGEVTTLAGTGATGFKDGAGAGAAFASPQGVGVGRDGTVYVADTGNHRVRKLAADGTVSTLAGDGTAGNTDGFGGRLNAPRGLAVDATRVVVADSGNQRIRVIALNGVLGTLAGSGTGNTDATASNAQFNAPSGVAIAPNGDVVVADTGNNLIRRVVTGGAVSTVVQAGALETPLLGPVAPRGVAVGADGTVYVADTGAGRIGVKGTGVYATFAGSATSPLRNGAGARALFWQPRGLVRDRSGNLYVADTANDAIRKITPDGTVSTYAGGTTGDADGPADIAKFRGPSALCLDPNGSMYVVESAARRIRKIDASKPGTPVVTTLAGDPTAKAEFLEGKGRAAHFDQPRGIAYGPDDKLYVADGGNHRIRTVAQDGVTSTYAGTNASSTQDGTLTSAVFERPAGLAFGADGTLYVTDASSQRLRKITRAGQVSTLAGHSAGDADAPVGQQAAFQDPSGLAVDAAGNVFVADAGNHRIRKVTPDGAVSTLAGSGLAGWLDGTGWLVRFSEPRDLALGAKGELYVVDAGTSRVRVLTP
ncbi:MAG: hypothetical protein JWM80_6558 [Cyanobacteria bacterium RYN_339]|nr:hypothetical protein [Cyanobacteria bacterium RYN_339]